MISTEQLDLAGVESGWEILTVEQDRKAGRFTAALLEKNQAKLAAVLEALAQGLSVRSIARAFSISTNTVLTAKRLHGAKIETEKQRLGRDCFDVARMAIERIRDEIDDMPKASLPIIAGIMADKGLLLTGAPTARIEHVGGPTVASVADYIASLPSAQPVGKSENQIEKGAVLELEAPTWAPSVDPQSTVSGSSTEGADPSGQDCGQIQPNKAPSA